MSYRYRLVTLPAIDTVAENADVPEEGQLVTSYLDLRRALGVLGLLLPVVLPAIAGELRPTISDFYGTSARDVLVGVLFAIATFLGTYRGYDWRDLFAGRLGASAAVSVAVFPSTSPNWYVSGAHVVAATVLFGVFAFYCLVLFVKTDPKGIKPVTPKKEYRNVIYRACGWTILACLVLIGVYGWQNGLHGPGSFLFWLEAIMLLAFGFAWLTKGEALLKDS